MNFVILIQQKCQRCIALYCQVLLLFIQSELVLSLNQQLWRIQRSRITMVTINLCVNYQKPILPPLDNYMSPDNRQNYFMAFLISSVAIIIQSLLLFWSCLQSPVLYDTWPWHWCTSHVTCHADVVTWLSCQLITTRMSESCSMSPDIT